MSDFTITKILGEEPFRSKHGSDLIAYTVTFEGDQGKGAAEHRRKATSPPPMEREVIDAEIVHEGEKVLLKRVYKPQGAQGGKAPMSGTFEMGTRGGYRPEDPKKSAEIRRMNVLARATELLGIEVQGLIAAGQTERFKSDSGSDWTKTDWIKKRADWYEQEVIDAGLRAELPDGR